MRKKRKGDHFKLPPTNHKGVRKKDRKKDREKIWEREREKYQ